MTISSILPLIDIILSFDNYENYKYIFEILKLINIDIKSKKIIIFYLLAFFLFFSYLFKIFLIYLSSYITYDLSLFIHDNVFNKILNQSFEYQTGINSSIILGSLEKADLARQSIFSLLQFFISLILGTSIFLFILFVDYKLTITLMFVAIFPYFIILLFFRPFITRISYQEAKLIDKRYKIILECSDNIKEIILRSLSSFFRKKLYSNMDQLKSIKIKSELLSNIPNIIIILFVSLILILIIYISAFKINNLTINIPIIASLIIAIQRLLPHVNNIYATLKSLKVNNNSVEDVFKIYNLDDKSEINKELNNISVFINKKFSIKNLYFSFSENTSLLENLNYDFNLGKIYQIKGPSGCGKTTLLDLIMGLRKINNGNFEIDGSKFDPYNNKKWQNLISYVPQNTILTDSTILENIGYGFDLQNIDQNLVRKACKIAEILEFIESTRDGFKTIIGQQGIRISGGQRQRLSIAKALYLNKPIILLDEATSSIDFKTEKKIYYNLKSFMTKKIIIVINHNETIINYYDQIYNLK